MKDKLEEVYDRVWGGRLLKEGRIIDSPPTKRVIHCLANIYTDLQLRRRLHNNPHTWKACRKCYLAGYHPFFPFRPNLTRSSPLKP